MNPLTKDSIDIDIELLEQTFEDDCKCESQTHDFGRVECSGEVTYLLDAVCTGPRKVCKAMGLKAIQYLNGNARRCGLCYRDLQDCWTIRPI